MLAAVGCLVGMQIIFSGRLECPLLSISNIRGGGCMQTAENQFDALEEEIIDWENDFKIKRGQLSSVTEVCHLQTGFCHIVLVPRRPTIQAVPHISCVIAIVFVFVIVF